MNGFLAHFERILIGKRIVLLTDIYRAALILFAAYGNLLCFVKSFGSWRGLVSDAFHSCIMMLTRKPLASVKTFGKACSPLLTWSVLQVV